MMQSKLFLNPKNKSNCFSKMAHQKELEKILEEHQEAIVEIQDTPQQGMKAFQYENVEI